jgi:hypothetical protein
MPPAWRPAALIVMAWIGSTAWNPATVWLSALAKELLRGGHGRPARGTISANQ